MKPEIIALLGVLLSSIISASVAIWIARRASDGERNKIESQIALEVGKLDLSSKKDKIDRKLDLAYKYAELKQSNAETAESFYAEYAKETAIGFILFSDDEEKRKIWIRDNSNILVGRRSSCNIVLDNIAVSREHCVLHTHDGNLFAIPLSPANPIRIDAISILGKTAIPHGSIVEITPYKFRYFSFRD